MMKRQSPLTMLFFLLVYLAISLVVWGSLAHAQSTDHPEWYSETFSNGRYWRDLQSTLAKVAYLAGVRDGVMAANSLDKTPAASFSGYEFLIPPSNLTYGDVAEWLDKFYEDPSNRPISIVAAITVFSAKARGKMNEAQIQEMTLEYRKAFAMDVTPPAPSKEVKAPK